MFGITSDVKIILKRIDDVQPEIPPKVLPQIGPISKSALEGIRKLIQGSQINLNKRKHDKTQVTFFVPLFTSSLKNKSDT